MKSSRWSPQAPQELPLDDWFLHQTPRWDVPNLTQTSDRTAKNTGKTHHPSSGFCCFHLSQVSSWLVFFFNSLSTGKNKTCAFELIVPTQRPKVQSLWSSPIVVVDWWVDLPTVLNYSIPWSWQKKQYCQLQYMIFVSSSWAILYIPHLQNATAWVKGFNGQLLVQCSRNLWKSKTAATAILPSAS